MKARTLRTFLFSLLGCWAVALAHGQSILAILNAIQDRNTAVQQRTAASFSGYTLSPITWQEGLGTNSPSSTQISNLSLASQIALLNDAVAQYEGLATGYAALSAPPGGTVTAGWNAGSIHAVNPVPIGLITADNYRDKLPLLAAKVSELKYLIWPYKSIQLSFNSGAIPPTTSAPSMANPTLTLGSCSFSTTGSYYSSNDIPVAFSATFTPPSIVSTTDASSGTTTYTESNAFSGDTFGFIVSTGLGSTGALPGSLLVMARQYCDDQFAGVLSNRPATSSGSWPLSYGEFAGVKLVQSISCSTGTTALSVGITATTSTPSLLSSLSNGSSTASTYGYALGFVTDATTLTGSWYVTAETFTNSSDGTSYMVSGQTSTFYPQSSINSAPSGWTSDNAPSSPLTDSSGMPILSWYRTGSDGTSPTFSAVTIAAGEVSFLYAPTFPNTVTVSPAVSWAVPAVDLGEARVDLSRNLVYLNAGRGLSGQNQGYLGLNAFSSSTLPTYSGLGGAIQLQLMADTGDFQVVFDDTKSGLPSNWKNLGYEWYYYPKIRQLVGQDVVVTVSQSSSDQYSLNLYHASQTGSLSNGVYVMNGNPFKTWVFTDNNPTTSYSSWTGTPVYNPTNTASPSNKTLNVTDGNRQVNLAIDYLDSPYTPVPAGSGYFSGTHFWTGSVTTSAGTGTTFVPASLIETFAANTYSSQFQPNFATISYSCSYSASFDAANANQVQKEFGLTGNGDIHSGGPIITPDNSELHRTYIKTYAGSSSRVVGFSHYDIGSGVDYVDGGGVLQAGNEPGWGKLESGDGINLTRIISQLGNNANASTSSWDSTLANANTATTISYSGYTQSLLTARANVTTGETWRTFSSDLTTITESVATSSSTSSATDSSNLTTVYFYYPGTATTSGTAPWALRAVIYPDQTALLRTYGYAASSSWTASNSATGITCATLTVTTSTGVPNSLSNPTAISSGTQEVTVTNLQGFVLSDIVSDFASGTTISSAVAGSTLDDFGRPTLIAYADSTTTSQTFFDDSRNLINYSTDRFGVTTTNSYDILGRLVSTARAGVTTTLSHSGFTTTGTVSAGGTSRTFSSTVDGFGELVASSSNLEPASQTTISYGSTISVSDALTGTSRSVVKTYNQDGTLATLSGTAVDGATYTYTTSTPSGGSGNYLSVLATTLGSGGSPTSISSTTYYDAAGRLSVVNSPDPSSTTGGSATTSYSYNSNGQLFKFQPPAGPLTYYGYNPLGQLIGTAQSFNASLASLSSTTGGIFGYVEQDTSFSSGQAFTTLYRQPGSGSGLETLSQATLGVGANAGSATLTPFGNSALATQITRSLSGSNLSFTASDSASGITTTTTFNPAFVTPSSSTAMQAGATLSSASITSDGLGRAAAVSYTLAGASGNLSLLPDGRTSTDSFAGLTSAYNYSTNLSSTTVSIASYSQNFGFDTQGREVSASGSGLQTINRGYTLGANGLTVTLSDGNSNTTTLSTNAAGLLAGKQFADSSTAGTPTFYADGSLHTLALPTAAGTTTASYTYSSGSAPIFSVSYTDSLTSPVTLSYDAALRVQNISDGSGTRTLTYTTSNLLASVAYTSGPLSGTTFTYSYDANLRLSSVNANVSSGASLPTISYSYSGASDRLVSVSRAGSTATHGATYSFSSGTASLASTTYVTGGTPEVTVLPEPFSLTPGRTVSQSVTLAYTGSTSGSITNSYSTTFDGNGRRSLTVGPSGLRWVYAYDPFGRLGSATKEDSSSNPLAGYTFSYSYDGAGTLSLSGTTVNNLNQVTAFPIPDVVFERGETTPSATVSATTYPLLLADAAPACTVVGSWTSFTSTLSLAGTALETSGGTGYGRNAVLFSASLLPGNWQVKLHWVAASTNAPTVYVRVRSNPTSQPVTVPVNEQANGGSWQTLPTPVGGTLSVSATAGRPVVVQVSDVGASGVVVADAVEFVPLSVPGSPPTLSISSASAGAATTSATVTAASTTGYFGVTVSVSNSGGPQLVESVTRATASQSGAIVSNSGISQNFVGPATATQSFVDGGPGGEAAGWRWNFGYDALGNLISVQTSTAAIAAGDRPRAITYSYDAEGRRWQKQLTLDNSGSVASTTQYFYDGWNLLYEVTRTGTGGSGSAIQSDARYVWGLDATHTSADAGGIGGLVLVETRANGTGNWTPYFPLYDPLNNIIGLANDSGAQVATSEYDPYGNVLRSTGPAAGQCNFGYSTKYTDPDTGLIYYGHRWYDPQTGRWLSREPLGESSSVNLYEAFDDDPINHGDILGLASVEVDKLSGRVFFKMDYGASYLLGTSDGNGGVNLSHFGRTGSVPLSALQTQAGYFQDSYFQGIPDNRVIAQVANAVGTAQDDYRSSLEAHLSAASPGAVDPTPSVGLRMAQGNTLGALDALFAIGTDTAALQDQINPNGGWGIIGGSYNANIRTPAANFLHIDQSDPVVGLTGMASNLAWTAVLFEGAARFSGVEGELMARPRTLTAGENALYGRVSRPKGFNEQVWELNKGQDGLVRDPTGKVLRPDEPWELGHTPGNKFSDAQIRAAAQGWDRATWVKHQNDPYIYRPELPRTNLGEGLPRINGIHLWEFTW